ncbi:MAG: hypothetical protein ACRDL7_12840, partial [Gaiellaceae bacterium]
IGWVIIGLSLLPWEFVAAHATVLEWDRNSESDMGHYEVLTCSVPVACIPSIKTGADVPQPTVGIKPTAPIPVNAQGNVAIIAVDLAGNKSGLSNVIPFDGLPPSNPAGLVVK